MPAKRKLIIFGVSEDSGSEKALNSDPPRDTVFLCHFYDVPKLPMLSLRNINIPWEEWMKRIQENNARIDKILNHFTVLCEEKHIQAHPFKEQAKPGVGLVETADNFNADLIIVGVKSKQREKVEPGTTATYVVRHSPIPVTVIP